MRQYNILDAIDEKVFFMLLLLVKAHKKFLDEYNNNHLKLNVEDEGIVYIRQKKKKKSNRQNDHSTLFSHVYVRTHMSNLVVIVVFIMNANVDPK